MKLEILSDTEAVAHQAALTISAAAREAVARRGRCVLALSGGNTPRRMMRILSGLPMPWEEIRIVQVDERVAPSGNDERNLTHLRANLLVPGPALSEHLYPMPVGDADLDAGARKYGRLLARIAGSPPVLDLVQLGLGADGHTASLVPGDRGLDVVDSDVAVTGIYGGVRRMTLTVPVINRARRRLWLVTGPEKAKALSRLCSADTSIPAGRIESEDAIVIADRAAAALLRGNAANGVHGRA